MVGTVLRFAEHLTGVCQELPEHVSAGSARVRGKCTCPREVHVSAGSARVRTSYHLHPAQPILTRATVAHPAIAGQFKVPPLSRCGASPAVRERAGGHFELGDMAVEVAVKFVDHQSEEGLPRA